jgi:hypothetical protein
MQIYDSFDSMTVDGSQQKCQGSFIMVPHLHMNIDLTHINCALNNKEGKELKYKVFIVGKNSVFIHT